MLKKKKKKKTAPKMGASGIIIWNHLSKLMVIPCSSSKTYAFCTD